MLLGEQGLRSRQGFDKVSTKTAQSRCSKKTAKSSFCLHIQEKNRNFAG